MTTIAHLNPEAFDQFRSRLLGTIVVPGEPDYESTCRVWNGLIDRHPAAVVLCHGVADVRAAVDFARTHGLPVTVRGGGHHVAGQAMADGGLTIDLSPMRGVRVDPAARTVRAEGGATWAEVDREAQVFNLAVPGGVVSETGIGGLTLGGGLGWLRRAFGLSCDNLRSVDIVTADGQVLTASEQAYPDLFWALRGGGHGLGVVTSFEYDAHPLGPDIYFAAVFHPYRDAAALLRRFRDHMTAASDGVNVLGVLGTFPDGSPFPAELHSELFIAFIGAYAGPVDEGEQALQPFRTWSAPLFDASGIMPYVDAQRFFDEDYPSGHRYYWKSLYLKGLGDDVIESLVNDYRRCPSQHSTIDVWPLGGAIDRVAADSAFAHRGAPYLIALEANWHDPSVDERNIAWVRSVWDGLEPFSTGGLYVNFPGFAEEDGFERAAFGGSYDRLHTVKQRYDPTNLFRLSR